MSVTDIFKLNPWSLGHDEEPDFLSLNGKEIFNLLNVITIRKDMLESS